MDHGEKLLAAHLYRLTCPSPDELGEYHLKLLPAERAAVIARHLPLCAHCHQEVAQLQAYLANLAPELEYSLRERVQIWIARLLPQGQGSGFSPAPALAFRGEVEGPRTYEAGGVQLHLDIQADPTNPGHKTVIGLVIGAPETTVSVQLWQTGRLVQETSLDEWGNFSLDDIIPGTFDLILSSQTAEIHVPNLDV
jgi:hypothetical protein